MQTLPLTQGYVALVDDEDFAVLSAFKWCVFVNPRTPTPYAIRSVHGGKRGTTAYLHRVIMGATPKQRVDHINGDGLDCRRANMRLCTVGENGRNRRKLSGTSSRYKGVSRRDAKWRARIRIDGVLKDLGTYATEEAAARAYDLAAVHHHGEFAHLNYPVHADCRR